MTLRDRLSQILKTKESSFEFSVTKKINLLDRREGGGERDSGRASSQAWGEAKQSEETGLAIPSFRLSLSPANEGFSLHEIWDAIELGLVKAVGVSNYSEKRLREAHAKLKKRGIPLASNQVNYSPIYRAPEENGVKSTCDELGITLIAYSPIAQGALTRKCTPENPPTGPRRQIYTPEFLSKLQSLLNRIKELGEKYSKTNTHVVLNWLIAQDNVVPIPGAKNAEQAAEFAGALRWRLNSEEVSELRNLATEIKPVTGFPVEKL
ncbi:oxidoreductase [Pyrus ussuriensis x Pyrus communis]|uniref:Oxidoreductase n=1 Tax=Pyrus ussuriensis x Pyrus communis TaxID=2448454 RepID=A0A5N5FWM3_9ROSA|nr:oxidoreductase [Pyrus ussuriensis x Pyrus communis]